MKKKSKLQKEIKKEICKTCSNDLVEVRSDSFAFCRYGIMVLAWIAVFFASKEVVLAIFIILLLSAIFSVKYAPMILIYNYTIGLFLKHKTEMLGISGMRFAHILGTVLAGIAVYFLYFNNVNFGWGIAIFLAIMKTISAFGLCPAYKLYNCMKSGGCCSFSKAITKNV